MLSVQKSAEVILAVFFQRRTESMGVAARKEIARNAKGM